MDSDKKLKQIEKLEAKLAREKKKILEAKTKFNESDAKLDAIVAESGFSNPKQLVKALIKKYKINITSSSASGSGSGKRVVVTAELRDLVKKGIAEGRSKNSLGKELNLTYPKIQAICEGKYDS